MAYKMSSAGRQNEWATSKQILMLKRKVHSTEQISSTTVENKSNRKNKYQAIYTWNTQMNEMHLCVTCCPWPRGHMCLWHLGTWWHLSMSTLLLEPLGLQTCRAQQNQRLSLSYVKFHLPSPGSYSNQYNQSIYLSSLNWLVNILNKIK